MFPRHWGTLERNNIFSSFIQAAAPTQQLANDEVIACRKVLSNRCKMFTEQQMNGSVSRKDVMTAAWSNKCKIHINSKMNHGLSPVIKKKENGFARPLLPMKFAKTAPKDFNNGDKHLVASQFYQQTKTSITSAWPGIISPSDFLLIGILLQHKKTHMVEFKLFCEMQRRRTAQ